MTGGWTNVGARSDDSERWPWDGSRPSPARPDASVPPDSDGWPWDEPRPSVLGQGADVQRGSRRWRFDRRRVSRAVAGAAGLRRDIVSNGVRRLFSLVFGGSTGRGDAVAGATSADVALDQPGVAQSGGEPGTDVGMRADPERADDSAGQPATAGSRAGGVRGFGPLALAIVVALCGLTLLAGFANKDRCTGPTFDHLGRSQPNFKQRLYGDVCYSDIQYLWIGRDIDRHVFPYVDGWITKDGNLVGGSVEYPVLTGMLIWVGALFASNDAQFLLASSLLLAPFGLLTAWFLGRLSRWRALVWALGPPLVLYAFHNWDLLAVCCSVAAVYVVHRGWGRAGVRRSLTRRAVVSSALLALGFAFKLYPGIFVLPLALYVLTGGNGGGELPERLANRPRRRSWLTGAAVRRRNWAGALAVLCAAGVTAVLVNLPFALAGYKGWRASFTFQQLRHVDLTSNSVWFWAFRPYSNPDNKEFQQLVNWLSPTLVVASFVLACVIGWVRYRRNGTFGWVGVSAAMLCGFLLLHKVHSPQYTLWLLPMFVLLRIRWGWVLGYFLVDLAMGIGIFRWYFATESRLPSSIYEGFSAQAVVLGVWGRAALLVGLFIVFSAAPTSFSDPPPGPAPTTGGGATAAPALA